jgi:hypothetical protein
MDLKEIRREYGDWIDLAHDRGRRRELVNIIRKIRVS